MLSFEHAEELIFRLIFQENTLEKNHIDFTMDNSSLKRPYYPAMDNDSDVDDLWDLDKLLEPTRKPKWTLERLDWSEHVKEQVHKEVFETKYHMALPSFNKLVAFLDIRIDIRQSERSSAGSGKDGTDVAAISPQLVVAMGLRFLGGEMIKSLEDIFKVHSTHVRRLIFEKFLPAVDAKFTSRLAPPCSSRDTPIVRASTDC